MESKERYLSIDGLRTFACFGIVLMHVQANILVKPEDCVLTHNIIGFTGNFVLLFMMVSAFSLCCGYYNKIKAGAIDITSFFSKRYVRILPFFALLCLIDVFKTILTEHLFFNDVVKSELYEVFANLTLLFGLIPGNDISVVGVGWFLGVIFVFYIFFPFFVFMLNSKKTALFWLIIACAMFFTLHNYFSPVKGVAIGNNSFICCLPFFLMGGVIFLYRKEICILIKGWLNVLFTTFTIGYTVFFFVFPEYRFQLANLLLYGLWLVYAITEVNSNRDITFLNNKYVLWFSKISMEVYLCHMMFFRIVEKIHIEKYIGNANVNYVVTCLMVLLFASLFSFIWKKCIEPRIILNFK